VARRKNSIKEWDSGLGREKRGGKQHGMQKSFSRLLFYVCLRIKGEQEKKDQRRGWQVIRLPIRAVSGR